MLRYRRARAEVVVDTGLNCYMYSVVISGCSCVGERIKLPQACWCSEIIRTSQPRNGFFLTYMLLVTGWFHVRMFQPDITLTAIDGSFFLLVLAAMCSADFH